jgi:predicted nucleotidyltransferase component of viral defense system
MITEAYMRRHTGALGKNREIALLDVAQEYVLEHLRREGAFENLLIFKGGTALRKFVFGKEGRFSVDLDFTIREEEAAKEDRLAFAGMILDMLDDVTCYEVRIRLDRRRDDAAQILLSTPRGDVTEPCAISIRTQAAWLPPIFLQPRPFEYLDRGLQNEFTRSQLPILDLREIAAEKLAAFSRRRMARDLYDLEHLTRVLQKGFNGHAITRLAALKIYFDAVDDGLPHPPGALDSLFDTASRPIVGVEDLGRLRALNIDLDDLLRKCAARYTALADVPTDVAALVNRLNAGDRWRAMQLREELVDEFRSMPLML